MNLVKGDSPLLILVGVCVSSDSPPLFFFPFAFCSRLLPETSRHIVLNVLWLNKPVKWTELAVWVKERKSDGGSTGERRSVSMSVCGGAKEPDGFDHYEAHIDRLLSSLTDT